MDRTTPPKLDRVLRSYLKLRHLRLLVLLDDTRNLRRAAALLGISQPATSKALSEIESAFGLQLFERSGGGTRPTLYGEVVVRFARNVLAEFNRTEGELAGLSEGTSGHVGIATTSVATGELLPRAIARLKQRAPHTTVLLEDGFLEALLPRLRSGEFDLVTSRLEPRWTSSDLEVEPLYHDVLTVVAHPACTIGGGRDPTWTELAAQPWIVPRAGTPVRLLLERIFRDAGAAPPRDVIEVASLVSIMSILRERPVLAVVGRAVARYLGRFGVARILPVAIPCELAPVGIMRLRGRSLTPAAALLAACLRETAQEMDAAPPPEPGGD